MKISLVLRYVLNSNQIFLQKVQENFLGEFIFLVLRKISEYFLDLRTYFSNQEIITQYALGFCSAVNEVEQPKA